MEQRTIRPEHVLDRTQVDLPLAGGVLGNVGQPQLVRRGSGEAALDQVVMHGRSGPLGFPAAPGGAAAASTSPGAPEQLRQNTTIKIRHSKGGDEVRQWCWA